MVAEGSPILQIGFGLIVVIFVALGVYGYRKVDDSASYDVADRAMSKWWVTGTMTASYLSASTFLGFTGAVYALGYGFIAIGLMAGAGMLVLAIFFAGPIRSLGEVTLPDYLGRRYDSKTLQGLVGGMAFFIVAVYAGGALIGLANVTGSLLSIDYTAALILVTIIIVGYTLLGGMTSVVHTDGIQLIIMFVGAILILPFAASSAGGFSSGISQLQAENWFTWHGGGALTFPVLLDFAVIWLLGGTALPFTFSRANVAKTPSDAVKGISWAAVTYFLIAISITLAVGMAATQVSLENPDQAYTHVALQMVPTAIGVTALLGILMAGISSADTQMLTAAQHLYRDFYHKALGRNLSEEGALKLSRLTVLVLGVLIFAVAYIQPGQLFAVVSFAVGWSVTSFFIPIAGGTYWHRGTENGAIASSVVGFLLLPILQFTGTTVPILLSNTLAVLVVAFVVYVGVSLAESSTPTDRAMEVYQQCKQGRLYLKDVN